MMGDYSTDEFSGNKGIDSTKKAITIPKRKTDLNRLSAEVLMGWVWSDEHEMWCDGSERDVDGRLTFANPDELDWTNDDPDEPGHQAPWHPLTDLNQCFQVVEKMFEQPEEIYDKFIGYLTRNCTNKSNSLAWWLAISNKTEAILTAALKAKGVCLEV